MEQLKSRLVVLSSDDRVSGNSTDFTVNVGQSLACDGYDSCYVRFIDAAIESSSSLTQFSHKDIYTVHGNLGQRAYDSGGGNDVLGYVKIHRNSTVQSGSVHQALTPNAGIYTECRVPSGILNFKLKGAGWLTVPATAITSTTIVMQMFYFDTSGRQQAL